MIYGIGNPKFYIYDSTGVTLQKTISTSLAPMRQKPTIEHAVKIETSPFTRTRLRDTTAEYYYYKEDLVYGIGDYNSTLLQYQADQASSKRNDIYKIKQVVDYSDAGYVVKYSPHSDLEDVWGFSPFQVNVLLQDFDFVSGGTNKTDMISVTIEGVASRSSAFMWNEFSFTELSGVTNSNQCLSVNGSSEYATCSSFSIGTTHTISFWAATDNNSTVDPVIIFDSSCYLGFIASGTLLRYDMTGGNVLDANIGATSSATKVFFTVTRSGNAVAIYKNAVLVNSGNITGNPSRSVTGILNISTSWYKDKIGQIAIYTDVKTQAEISQQYNSGYGNWPLRTNLAAYWSFDGLGGTGTATESDQSGNSRTLTLVDTPTRTTW